MRYEFDEQEVINILSAHVGVKKGRGRFMFDHASGKFGVIVESSGDVLRFVRPRSD